MRSTRRLLAVLVTSIISLASLTVAAGTASADDFYTPPSPLPAGDDGDIIRHQPADFFLDPVKLLHAPADAQRVMYRSTDTHGEANAVTGTVLTPHTPWKGSGERPIIAYTPGTQGVGDDCAPSKALALGTEYEGPFISGLLARGYAVVVTDYEGLGTPGTHTYVNRKSEAHATLDAIRAAQRLPEANLPDAGPVAIAGYSQGGGAAAAAAELQASYAPELDLKGTYAGAPPADLAAVADRLDGHYAVGFLLFAVASMNEAYPELDIPSLLNDKGKQVWQQVESECTADALLKHAFTQTKDLTADGRPITDYLSEEPFASAVEEQRIGTVAPSAPTLVTASATDDIVPYDQGRAMARSWCEQGGTVKFSTLATPTHVGGYVASVPRAFLWLDARLKDKPAPTNCGEF